VELCPRPDRSACGSQDPPAGMARSRALDADPPRRLHDPLDIAAA
jgi:hypothetical protein